MIRYLAILLYGISFSPLAFAQTSPKAPLKFQFSPGKPAAGYALVTPDHFYDSRSGFGFEKGAEIEAVSRGGDNPLQSGFCSSKKPFYFSVALPPGNFKVTVTLGDSQGESETTVKAELRRLMLENVITEKGKTLPRSFIVNVRTPAIAGGGKVSLKVPRESVDEAWAWDDRLTLEFNGKRPCLIALEIEKVDVPTIFILGDSTVCDQSKEPYASWGQMLPRFLKPEIAVANHAESGESLRSSEGAHRLDKVLGDLKPGDAVLIQFGHNDMKSKNANAAEVYKATLLSWIKKIKAAKGVPVLVTPVNRFSFQGNTISNSLGEFPQMVREAAEEEKVALIDLNAMSKTLYEALGPKNAIRAFKHNSDDDREFDRTHHSPYGAYELAKCIVKGIQDSKLDIAKYIVGDFGTFDPAKPDAFESFKVPASPGFTNKRPLGD